MENNITVIAEAGVNHNGSMRLARKLVEVAADSGADYVKFQTFITEEGISKNAQRAKYQIINTGNDESQFEMIKKLELSFEQHKELKKFCEKIGIKYLSTPFDLKSIDFLDSIDIDFFKIPSGEITNLPFLRKIESKGRPIILSTGMANLFEIRNALEVLNSSYKVRKDITVLHCTTEYPAPINEVNLDAMITIRDEFRVPVGYSDHTLGIEIPIAAAALGAKVIEKHFTLDCNLDGPDHAASLEPNDLKDMISGIRKIELAMGHGEKKPSQSEKQNIAIARKSIIARTLIKKGDKFTEQNLTVKRPGTGISPMNWDKILGSVSDNDYDVDELIKI